MDYSDGKPVNIGDIVKLWEGKFGIIVCDFDKFQFIKGYSANSWSNIKSGVMIEADSGDCFHYEDMDEDIELIERR